MHSTQQPAIDALLAALVADLERVLGPQLVGVYLYGSLVWGDFDAGLSDVDLLVVLSADLDDAQFAALDRVHARCVAEYLGGNDQLEIAYASLAALQTFKLKRSTIWVISPGEPFHPKQAGRDWLINWYLIQERGVALFGPPPESLIPSISRDEFVAWVRAQAQEWRTYVAKVRDWRPGQAYAILTLCRALYAARTGKQVSKRQAALWTIEQLPEWADLIRSALEWRRSWAEPVADHGLTYPATERFVQTVADLLLPTP